MKGRTITRDNKYTCYAALLGSLLSRNNRSVPRKLCPSAV